MTTFDRALEFALSWENEYENDPRDPGGETRLGIAKRFYPNLDIKNLTMDDVRAIYRRDYWNRLKCGEIAEIAPLTAISLFDFGVVPGQGAAGLSLQMMIDSGLKLDGVVGPKTLAAFKGAFLRHGDVGLARGLVLKRRARFVIAANRYNLGVYLKGWLNRCAAMDNLIKEAAKEG